MAIQMSTNENKNIRLTRLADGNTLQPMSESPSKRKHSSALYIRVTPEHEELIRQAAELTGTSVSDWIRDKLVRAARKDIAEASRYEAAGKAQE